MLDKCLTLFQHHIKVLNDLIIYQIYAILKKYFSTYRLQHLHYHHHLIKNDVYFIIFLSIILCSG